MGGILALAAQVEHWFGPMVEEPGFQKAVRAHLRAGTALIADGGAAADAPRGALLFDASPPTYHVDWLVVSEEARGRGVGRALLEDAYARFVRAPGTVEVVTFGADHPGAVASNARVFYERLGFTPAELTTPGPEGGSRQIYRRPVSPTPGVR
ncbi:GNAT family N-acetyltransferase [Streptomyces alkaliterrae]|nr:GNAT family N-acetyltransferase [Streptomyces alkaliterrae]